MFVLFVGFGVACWTGTHCVAQATLKFAVILLALQACAIMPSSLTLTGLFVFNFIKNIKLEQRNKCLEIA